MTVLSHNPDFKAMPGKHTYMYTSMCLFFSTDNLSDIFKHVNLGLGNSLAPILRTGLLPNTYSQLISNS